MRPASQIGEAVRLQNRKHANGRHHHARRRRMEAPEPGVAPALRNVQRLRQDVRKAGVERRRERQPMAQAVGARRAAERPLGGDVDRIRPRLVEHALHVRARPPRELDLAVAGTAITTTSWPRECNPCCSSSSVVTTPLTCGNQASVTRASFMRAPWLRRGAASRQRCEPAMHAPTSR